MRKVIVAGIAGALLLSGCGKSGYDRARPDEFAVARQAPLVIPPDFGLVPPVAGAPRPQDQASNAQTLEALFGAPANRSAAERSTVSAAGGDAADPGIRSTVGDPGTNVVDKGATTRDIVAAPEGDGAEARAATPASGTPAAPRN